VRRALQRAKGRGLILVRPKSAAGRRSIALPPTLVTALREHRAAQLTERLQQGPAWTGWRAVDTDGVERDIDLVFTQRTGRPVDLRQDWATWKRLLADAVRDVRVHDARHTAATLLQQGVPARVAMQILGHSQIGLTLGTYSHVVPELAAEGGRGRRRRAVANVCRDDCRGHRHHGRPTASPQVKGAPPAGIEPATVGLEVRCSVR
jgi:integrase